MPQTTPRRSRLRLLGAVALLAGLLPSLLVGFTPTPAAASSHREAPLIAEDKVADGTDVYAFVSPDKTDTVTLVANYVPLQLPAGGPNFDKFGDDVRYEINVDSNGDAVPDIVFRFEFDTTTVNPNTFLYNTGPMSYEAPSGGFPNGRYLNWNRPQTYTLTILKGANPPVVVPGLLTPPVNVGPNSAPNYPALAAGAIKTNVGGLGITSFAGQRDDPFFVDLGRTFDLLGVNPAGGTDFVGGLSVNSLVLQVPKTYLQGSNANDPVIGVWSTSSRQTTTVLNPGTSTPAGAWVQVSRLGMPLVNEAVIPLKDKDKFNGTVLAPNSDNPFASYVTTPELAGLFVALGVDADTPTTNRNDLVTVFLTGVPGLNKPASVSPTEMIRLNMSIAPSTTNPNTVNRMGVLGGQFDGFPNGRRLADDVADIELQAIAGILCQPGGALTAAVGQCRATAVNTALGDGVNANDLPFQTVFPYIANPRPPYGDGSTPPSVPSYKATVTIVGSGTVTNGSDGKSIANGASVSQGGVLSLSAVPTANNIFIGWSVDGQFVGIKTPLNLNVSRDRAVTATFAPRIGFGDVPSNDPAAEAIVQMASRGFIRGTGPGTFEPARAVIRAEAAALIGRPTGLSAAPSGGNPFSDRCKPDGSACIDDELWGLVASLAANGIAQGWNDAPTCASAGTTVPCYLPRDEVTKMQVISFISRAFVAKGYWTKATTDTGVYANVPASTGVRLDLVTFVNNAGALPDLPTSGPFTGYDQSARRDLTARLIFQAYSAYYSINRVPTP